jgi:hypothetical protein
MGGGNATAKGAMDMETAGMNTTELKHEIVFPRDLSAGDRLAMYGLMAENYRDVTPRDFERDLDKKDVAAVLRSGDGSVRGFTTFALNPGGYRAEDHDILFSGDTIIDPAYWGSLEMMRGFTVGVGRILGGLGGPASSGAPRRRLFWLLTSKGHRTYMLMALFCKVFHPCHAGGEPEELREIARRCGRLLYPAHWQEETGVLRHSGKNGPLKHELVQGTYERRQNPHVRFFLDANPGFAEGDELLCVAELHPDNSRRSARDHMLEGMTRPIFTAD